MSYGTVLSGSVYDEVTAILVDGGFYRKRAEYLFGRKSPANRAQELVEYCCRHLGESSGNRSKLYRIFYYDCPPIGTPLYHPLLQKTIDMGKTPMHSWMTDFLEELSCKRKLALRMGELQEKASSFVIKDSVAKKLFRGEIGIDELCEHSFVPNIVQKGVDMKIGLDISSMAQKRQVTQMVLIAGDSDFVPAAKYARREGVDFILDPMWQKIRPNLSEHIDGLRSCTYDRPSPEREKLHVDYGKTLSLDC